MRAPDKAQYLFMSTSFEDDEKCGVIYDFSDKELEEKLNFHHSNEGDVGKLIELYKEVLRRELQRKEGLVGLTITFNSQAQLNGSGAFEVRIPKGRGKFERRFYRAGFLEGKISSLLLFTSPKLLSTR